MTDTIHYDKELSGMPMCGIVDYDYAHEDLSKVTCKSCIRREVLQMGGHEMVAMLKFIFAEIEFENENYEYITNLIFDIIGKSIKN